MDPWQLLSVMVGQPLLALLPAAVLLAAWGVSRSRWALAAGLMWLAYCPYELAMKYRVLCSGECNIRIDLLVVYPVLLLASVIALVAMAMRFRRRGNRGGP